MGVGVGVASWRGSMVKSAGVKAVGGGLSNGVGESGSWRSGGEEDFRLRFGGGMRDGESERFWI